MKPIKKHERTYLPLLSIEAAEELQRLKLRKGTGLKNTKELSKLVKNEFPKRLDYKELFSKAYSSVYYQKDPELLNKDPEQYIKEISNKLDSPLKLEFKEFEKIVRFCAKLSDYSSIHEEEIRILKQGGCF